MKIMTLWHISPSENAHSIFTNGIIPMYGADERDKVNPKWVRAWYVRWYGIAWAILHVSFKKRCPVWKLAVFRVRVSESKVTHFRGQVYTTACTLYPTLMMSAEHALNTIERQRRYASK